MSLSAAVRCFCQDPGEVLCWYSCFREQWLVGIRGVEPGRLLCLQVGMRRQNHAGPSLVSPSHENFKGRASTVPESRGGVGGMGDLQRPYIFKKSVAFVQPYGAWCAKMRL